MSDFMSDKRRVAQDLLGFTAGYGPKGRGFESSSTQT